MTMSLREDKVWTEELWKGRAREVREEYHKDA